jgi:hypothetical protein
LELLVGETLLYKRVGRALTGGYPGLAVLTQPRPAGQKTPGSQIFTRFRLNRRWSRFCATDAQSNND